MADESKPPQQKWYHTAPGYLTATAALVGSITAAVTGLSQLGVFHSKTDTPPAAVAPAPTSSSQRSSEAGRRGGSDTRAPARSEPTPRTGARTAPAPCHVVISCPSHCASGHIHARACHGASRRAGRRTRAAASTRSRCEDRKHRSRNNARARERIARVQQQQQRRRQVHRDDRDARERQQWRHASGWHAGDPERRHREGASVHHGERRFNRCGGESGADQRQRVLRTPNSTQRRARRASGWARAFLRAGESRCVSPMV